MLFLRQVVYNMLLFMALSVLFKTNFYVADWKIALLAAIILGVLNALIRPILYILSLPINILTLGLFSIVINAFMLELTADFIGHMGFAFSSFPIAMLVAFVMSIANMIIGDYYYHRRE